MSDMIPTIIAKSDQLNADDLIGGALTITITGVAINPTADQPVKVSYQGDHGKPWKPCKSMRRILVMAWGSDSKAYIGRSLTLYRDPTAKWGGVEVGGIRISHMSHIQRPMTVSVSLSRDKRKPCTIEPLAASEVQTKQQATTAKTIPLWTPSGIVECASGQEWVTTLEGWLKAGTDESAEIWAQNSALFQAMRGRAEESGNARAVAFFDAVAALKPEGDQ